MSTKKDDETWVKISKRSWVKSTKETKNWNGELEAAEVASSPTLNGAAVVETFAKAPFGALDAVAVVSALNEQIAEVKNGDMSGVEAMLFSQATALQSIFVSYARRAHSQEYQHNLEAFMALALKAQAQCRATLEALNEVKFPKSATFVKQANIAQQQQVNNGSPPRAEKKADSSNELLKEANHGALDTSAADAAERGDPTMETVGEIDGAKHQRGEKAKQPERT